MKSGPRVVIVPITWQGTYRSASLSDWLGKTTLPVRPVPAVDGVEAVQASPPSAAEVRAELALSGRRLADREVGASLAHRGAYEEGYRTGAEWTLVVEDDLRVLPDSESSALRLLLQASQGGDAPMIVNLQPGGGVRRIVRRPLSRRDGTTGGSDASPQLIRLVELPPSALAYAVNRRALEIALTAPSRPATSPDWPPWVSRCRAFGAWPGVFGGEEGTTLISQASVVQSQARRDVFRNEILARALKRMTGMAWFDASAHYLTFGNYLNRELASPLMRRILGRFRRLSPRG